MYSHSLLIFVFVVLFANLNPIGASVCKSNSKFKIDCNTCRCSSNGKEYTCTNQPCPPNEIKDKYDVTFTKDGYKLLVPKTNDEFNFEDDDFVLKKSRKTRVPDGYPYINDEVYFPEDMDSKGDNNRINSIDNFIEVDGKEPVEVLDEGNTIDDEDDNEFNDISHDRWERFIPRQFPDFPE